MPIILLRNLDFHQGLANGTRLVVVDMMQNLIKARIMTGSDKHFGKEVLIPRIPLSPPDNCTIPILFTRKQFPVRPAFALTINKSQGQTFSRVGIYLQKAAFSHGQLYVAMSRVGEAKGIKVMIINPRPRSNQQPNPLTASSATTLHQPLLPAPPPNMTPNIVFQEVFDLQDPSPRGREAAAAWRDQQHAQLHRYQEDQLMAWPPTAEQMGGRLRFSAAAGIVQTMDLGLAEGRSTLRLDWLENPLIAHALGRADLYPSFPSHTDPNLGTWVEAVRTVIISLPSFQQNMPEAPGACRQWADVVDGDPQTSRRVRYECKQMIMHLLPPNVYRDIKAYALLTATTACEMYDAEHLRHINHAAHVDEMCWGLPGQRSWPPSDPSVFGPPNGDFAGGGLTDRAHRTWFLSPLIGHVMGGELFFPDFLIHSDEVSRLFYEGLIVTIREAFERGQEEDTFEYLAFDDVYQPAIPASAPPAIRPSVVSSIGPSASSSSSVAAETAAAPNRISNVFLDAVVDFLCRDEDTRLVLININRHMCQLAQRLRMDWDDVSMSHASATAVTGIDSEQPTSSRVAAAQNRAAAAMDSMRLGLHRTWRPEHTRGEPWNASFVMADMDEANVLDGHASDNPLPNITYAIRGRGRSRGGGQQRGRGRGDRGGSGSRGRRTTGGRHGGMDQPSIARPPIPPRSAGLVPPHGPPSSRGLPPRLSSFSGQSLNPLPLSTSASLHNQRGSLIHDRPLPAPASSFPSVGNPPPAPSIPQLNRQQQHLPASSANALWPPSAEVMGLLRVAWQASAVQDGSDDIVDRRSLSLSDDSRYTLEGWSVTAASCAWLWSPLIAHAMGEGGRFPDFPVVGSAGGGQSWDNRTFGHSMMASVSGAVRYLLRINSSNGPQQPRGWSDISNEAGDAVSGPFIREFFDHYHNSSLISMDESAQLFNYAGLASAHACQTANDLLDIAAAHATAHAHANASTLNTTANSALVPTASAPGVTPPFLLILSPPPAMFPPRIGPPHTNDQIRSSGLVRRLQPNTVTVSLPGTVGESVDLTRGISHQQVPTTFPPPARVSAHVSATANVRLASLPAGSFYGSTAIESSVRPPAQPTLLPREQNLRVSRLAAGARQRPPVPPTHHANADETICLSDDSPPPSPGGSEVAIIQTHAPGTALNRDLIWAVNDDNRPPSQHRRFCPTSEEEATWRRVMNPDGDMNEYVMR